MFASVCVCPGDTLSYECTVKGGPGQATVWSGTAIDCPSSNNKIILIHTFAAEGTYHTCNNGAIVARSLLIEDTNYTSKLNVTLTSETMGKTIKFLHDNGSISTTLFSLVIPTAGLPPYITN